MHFCLLLLQGGDHSHEHSHAAPAVSKEKTQEIWKFQVNLWPQIFQGSSMWLAIGKTVLAAILISFVSWLSGKKTGLAGFLTALPLTTLLALTFSQMEWGDSKQSIEYAKSAFVAIPVSLFFVPFLLA